MVLPSAWYVLLFAYAPFIANQTLPIIRNSSAAQTYFCSDKIGLGLKEVAAVIHCGLNPRNYFFVVNIDKGDDDGDYTDDHVVP